MERDPAGHPYNTHLPVLDALDPKPRWVLEFGSGLYSTRAFLEMPSVERLVSIEVFDEWRETVWQEFTGDRRWTLLNGEDEVPPFEGFDLIFVDDGQDPLGSERIATIEYVLSQRHPKVVIHDAEYAPFLGAIDRLASDYKVHAELTPHTAVVEATA